MREDRLQRRVQQPTSCPGCRQRGDRATLGIVSFLPCTCDCQHFMPCLMLKQMQHTLTLQNTKGYALSKNTRSFKISRHQMWKVQPWRRASQCVKLCSLPVGGVWGGEAHTAGREPFAALAAVLVGSTTAACSSPLLLLAGEGSCMDIFTWHILITRLHPATSMIIPGLELNR